MAGDSNVRDHSPAPRMAPGCCTKPGRLRVRATARHAALFKALGDPTRLEMIGLLAAHRRELCACELESHFDLSQPTISHHLRLLREAEVVAWERRGTWIYYTLHPSLRERLEEFGTLLAP